MERGDRFGLMMRNHPEYVESMIAASISGCVFVPIDPRTRGEKLAYMLRNAGCRGVVCSDYCLAEVAARKEVPELGWVLGLETGEGAGGRAPRERGGAVDSMREALARRPTRWSRASRDGNDPLQIIYTSGTTGDPKGVVFRNVRFGGSSMIGHDLRLPARRATLHRALSDPRQRAGRDARLRRLGMGLRAIFSRTLHEIEALRRLPRARRAPPSRSSAAWRPRSTASPSAPTTPTTRCAWWSARACPAAIWEPSRSVSTLEISSGTEPSRAASAFKPVGEGPIGSFGKPGPNLELKILDENDVECPPA